MCALFVVMATFSKWFPIWLAHVAVSAISKTLVFVTKGMFQLVLCSVVLMYRHRDLTIRISIQLALYRYCGTCAAVDRI